MRRIKPKKPRRRRQLWFVVYDNGYGRPEMAVVSALDEEDAEKEARLSWQAVQGTDEKFESRNLYAQEMDNLVDGWTY